MNLPIVPLVLGATAVVDGLRVAAALSLLTEATLARGGRNRLP